MDAGQARYLKLLNGRTPEQYDLEVEAEQIAKDNLLNSDPEYAELFDDETDTE